MWKIDYTCNLDLYLHLYLGKRGAAALKASLQHVRTVQNSMTAICWSNTKANSAAFSTSGMSAIEILGHVYSQIHICAKQILHVKKQVIPLLLIKTKNTVCFWLTRCPTRVLIIAPFEIPKRALQPVQVDRDMQGIGPVHVILGPVMKSKSVHASAPCCGKMRKKILWILMRSRAACEGEHTASSLDADCHVGVEVA